jgi:hypothetical protein
MDDAELEERYNHERGSELLSCVFVLVFPFFFFFFFWKKQVHDWKNKASELLRSLGTYP